MASKEVEMGDHSPAITVSNTGGIFLYQAYLGRVTDSTFEVFVDDHSIATGTTSTMVGDTARTWYDGISFAQINPPAGLPYDTWVTGYSLIGNDALPGFDYDGDGLPNAVEFVLGGNPSVADAASVRPTYSLDDTSFTYEFRRLDESNVAQGYSGTVYYSTGLTGWTEAVNGANGIVITEENDFYSADVDKVAVQLPNSLATGGQLFIRFGATPTGP
jgi:hypothetical protein